jgi:long-chain acyl-CoA synthetase
MPITYTSGTTADPKGITLTHRNTPRTWSSALRSLRYRLLSIPAHTSWDHSFTHTAGVHLLIGNGAHIGSVHGRTYAERPAEYPTQYP